MRRSQSLFLTWTLAFAVIALLAGVALAQDADKAAAARPTPAVGEITIEKIPAQKVLVRQVQGGYDKHQEVFSDLKGTATRALGAGAGTGAAGAKAAEAELAADCVGLYAVDPDSTTTATAKAAFNWSAALLVPDNFKLPAGTRAKALSVPASDYKMETLPAIEAAVMYSTIGRAPTDGLKFFSWMADNGYVQVGPTRMVYFTDPKFDLLRATAQQVRDSKTKIIVPIHKRERPIALKNEKQ